MVPLDDEAQEAGPTLYRAMGQLVLQEPNGQQQAVPFRVEIPGTSIWEAFANLPAALADAQKKAIAEIQAQQRPALVVPGANGRMPPNLRLA